MIEEMNTDLSASQILIVTGKEGRKLLHFVRNDDYQNRLVLKKLNSEQKPEECDATDDDSSTEAG